MTHRLTRGGFVAAALCVITAALHAAVPTFWQVGTEAEFLKGEVENLSVDSYGRLTLGPASSPIYDASAPFLWAMVDGPDGSVYVGSGNEGQVYRVDATGRGTVFFDAEELEVHALATAPNGVLYAGTSPDGRIYKLDSGGTATPFFDPADKYIWSLAVDRTGHVFAATGDKGVVYKIAPDGKGSVFYSTKATHAISLGFDRDNRLLVGTESPGRLFRVDAAGKPFVLLDSPYNEIHAIRVDTSGNIYAAAVSARSGGGGSSAPPAQISTDPAPPPIASVSTEILSISIAEAPTSSGTTTPAPRTQGPAAGAIYRVMPDGVFDLIWESREDSPYDLAPEADGTILVATGNKGKIYRLSGDPLQPTLIARANAQQVTTLLRDRAGRTLVATANPGKLLRLSPSRADRGTYVSDVRDAQSVAAWGTLKWQGTTPAGGRIEISTRSGNTRTPDETWSDWSSPYANPQGSPIVSPRARYLQWRATLVAGRDDSPLLTSVTAAYLPRNTRPKVTSITINPPGTVFQRPFPTGEPEIAGFEGETPDRRFAAQAAGQAGSTPSLGRRAYQKGLLTFVWRAEDENKDDLTYDVSYRREGETTWKTLRKGLTDSIVVWDTTSVPNGRYVVRVGASDLPSNAPAAALVGTLDSTGFEVDNTPPTVLVTSARRDGSRLILAFGVKDEDSAVQKAEYSLDGEQWQAIYPKDGIPDSKSEDFELVLDGEMAARGVIIRAADALNNVASARAEAPAASNRR